MANPKPEIPEFVQTARAQIAELDDWKQIGEEEARMAYEMTLRNELSGGTPVVREFERRWLLEPAGLQGPQRRRGWRDSHQRPRGL